MQDQVLKIAQLCFFQGSCHQRTSEAIDAWKGPVLQGSFLLIMSKELGTVRGKWVGTGDVKPYFGDWSWTRKNE